MSRAVSLQTFFLGLLATVAVGAVLHLTRAITIPLAIATLLVILLAPLQRALEERKLPRSLINLSLVLGLVLVVAGLVALVASVGRSVTSELADYEVAAKSLAASVDRLTRWHFGVSVTREIATSEALTLTNVASSGPARAVVSGLRDFASGFVLTVLFLVFMLASRQSFTEKLRSSLSARGFNEASSDALVASMAEGVRGYLVLKTLISVGTGVVVSLIAFAFGLDFAILWGLLTAILNYVPVLGPMIASVPAIAIAFLQFDDPVWALLVSVTIAVVQFVSSNVIEPKLMGDRFNLNTVAVLVSLLTWGMLWGFPGMVLSVPMTASVSIVLAKVPLLKSISMWLTK